MREEEGERKKVERECEEGGESKGRREQGKERECEEEGERKKVERECEEGGEAMGREVVGEEQP